MEKETLAALAETHALKIFVYGLIATMTQEQRNKLFDATGEILDRVQPDEIHIAAVPIIRQLRGSLA